MVQRTLYLFTFISCSLLDVRLNEACASFPERLSPHVHQGLIILNAILESNNNTRVNENIIEFIFALDDAVFSSNKVIVFGQLGLINIVKNNLSKLQNNKEVYFCENGAQQLEESNIGRNILQVDHTASIIYILEFMSHYFSIESKSNSPCIILTLSEYAYAVPTKTFSNLFRYLHSPNSLIFLGKNKRLTSPSDWRDLMVVGMHLSGIAMKNWVDKFSELYSHYSRRRKAFTMFDPRPALLETNLKFRDRITFHYIRPHEICVYVSDGDRPRRNVTLCHPEKSALDVHCEYRTNVNENNICALVSDSQSWKKRINRDLKDMVFRVTRGKQHWSDQLHQDPLQYGTRRMLLAAESGGLPPFCWEIRCA